jgi:hypothetical protein
MNEPHSGSLPLVPHPNVIATTYEHFDAIDLMNGPFFSPFELIPPDAHARVVVI